LFPQRSAFSVFAAVEFPSLYQENKKTEAGQKLRSKRNGAASKASCRRKYVKAAIGGKGRTQGAPSADIFSEASQGSPIAVPHLCGAPAEKNHRCHRPPDVPNDCRCISSQILRKAAAVPDWGPSSGLGLRLLDSAWVLVCLFQIWQWH